MRVKEDGVLPRHAKIVAISPQSIILVTIMLVYGIVDGNFAEDGNGTGENCFTQLYIRKGKLRHRIELYEGDSFTIGRNTKVRVTMMSYTYIYTIIYL